MATKTVKQAISNIAKINNAEFWDLCRRFSPDFKSHTAKKTLDEFTTKGFEEIQIGGTNVLNEFFETSMRVAFQMLNVARARNPLVDKGLVTVYDTPNGGYIQRISVNSIKPVSPAYLNLKDGSSVDPFVVRKPEIDERFFEMNFDYQSLITVQEYQIKTMFINEFGMGELLAGILEGLANGYTKQEYLNTKECLNTALNSSKFPLKDTQVLTLNSWTPADPTEEELKNFIESVMDTATRFETVTSTAAFNAKGFETIVDSSDMVLVLRAGIKNKIKVRLMVGAFNEKYLALPFDIVEVDDFGGLEHYSDAEFTTKIYPVYDELGAQIGWNTVEGQGTPNVDDSSVYKKDPNAEVIGMLVQRGAIFENVQNPYTVTPIYNPRGMYTNYIANKPNNGINWDALYNLVVFRAPAGA